MVTVIPVMQTHRHLAVRQNLQIQTGTALQHIHKHGTEAPGHRLTARQITIQQKVQLHAVLSAQAHTIGMAQIAF